MQNAGHTRIGGPRRKRRRMSLAGGQQVDDPMDHPDLSSSEGEIGLEHNIEHDSWGSETEEQEKKWESTWEAGLSASCCSRNFCSFSHALCVVLRFSSFSYTLVLLRPCQRQRTSTPSVGNLGQLSVDFSQHN
jgi:hypothetical protein